MLRLPVWLLLLVEVLENSSVAIARASSLERWMLCFSVLIDEVLGDILSSVVQLAANARIAPINSLNTLFFLITSGVKMNQVQK